MERLIRHCRRSNQKAAHGCAMQVAASRRYDFGRRGWGVCVQIDYLPVASQLNRWLLKRRRASVKRLTETATIRRCCTPAASLVSVKRDERANPEELSRCVVLLLMRADISLSYDG